MEIKTSDISSTEIKRTGKSSQYDNSDKKFSDELKELKKSEEKEKSPKNTEKIDTKENSTEVKKGDQVSDAIDDLNKVVSKLNQSEDSKGKGIKDNLKNTDKYYEGVDVINNDFNIENNKDKLPQMMPNMNFGGDGQPFSSFMSNSSDNPNGEKGLTSTAKEIAEEAAILSTMAENIAMANKVNINEPSEKTVYKEDSVKKIDTKSNIVKEIVVKYDSVIMNEADVEIFADLVNGKEINPNDLGQESVHKSVQVSKTLADMLAKSMQENKPVRIEFDNGISVIIKISKDGKLSADFLPSTQIAEAYLKENLPLLKQRFEDQNLEYGELNQRERRNREREQDKKKGHENE